MEIKVITKENQLSISLTKRYKHIKYKYVQASYSSLIKSRLSNNIVIFDITGCNENFVEQLFNLKEMGYYIILLVDKLLKPFDIIAKSLGINNVIYKPATLYTIDQKVQKQKIGCRQTPNTPLADNLYQT